MALIFIILAVFFIGKWIIESVFLGLFGVDKKHNEKLDDFKQPPTVINNYYTENHLHVGKDDLERFKG